MLKKIYLISIPIMVVFNILNLKNGDVRLNTTIAIIIILALIGIKYYNYKTTLGFLTLLLVTNFIIQLLIEYIGNITVETDKGQIVPLDIQLIAKIGLLIFMILVVSIMSLIKYIIIQFQKN